MLRPRERRKPRMPNQLSAVVEERIVAFALAHPGLGPRRIVSELARRLWGGIIVSPNGVWCCLRRHGLNTRAKRLVFGCRVPCSLQPPREPKVEALVQVDRPGELVGIDCFHVARLRAQPALSGISDGGRQDLEITSIPVSPSIDAADKTRVESQASPRSVSGRSL